jgi:uncharacterized protein YceK
MKVRFSLLVLLAALVFIGCSSIMRPPSATAFMSSYQKQAYKMVMITIIHNAP